MPSVAKQLLFRINNRYREYAQAVLSDSNLTQAEQIEMLCEFHDVDVEHFEQCISNLPFNAFNTFTPDYWPKITSGGGKRSSESSG